MNESEDNFPTDGDQSLGDNCDWTDSSKNDEKRRLEKEHELWVRASKTESRMVLIVFLVLGIMTVYCAFLNFYIIAHSIPQPYRLRLGNTMPLTSRAEYRLLVKWDKIEGLPDPVRPELFLDGKTPVPLKTSAAEKSLLLKVNKNYTVQVAFPENCAPALHRGELIFEKVLGGKDLPPLVTAPVSVEVTADLFKNWFVMKWWLAIMITILILLYLFCIVDFPAPSGWLIFQDPTGTYCPSSRAVPLRLRSIALAFPWKRSSLNLKALWKEARISLPLQEYSEVLFLFKNRPVLISRPWRTKAAKIVRLSGPDDSDTASAHKCGLMEIMPEDIPFAYVTEDFSIEIRFTYTRKPGGYKNI